MEQPTTMITNKDVVAALNIITRGRMVTSWDEVSAGTNPYVVTKTSHIPGKGIVEIPGLIFGDPAKEVKRIGVGMTLTENMIELASGMELDLLVVHHPVAEAASSGGVPFGDYLPLYGLSVIELHEAFHGLHPGMTMMHGHQKLSTDISFGGVPGNVLHKGVALEGVATVADLLGRLAGWLDRDSDHRLLEAERMIRGEATLQEATMANPSRLLSGRMDKPVKHILHFFPHTGFSLEHLEQALLLYPETDTIIVSISRVREGHPFVSLAQKRGLNFIVGNSHSVEIMENGLPLAYALEMLLPSAEVFLLRERVTAVPLTDIGSRQMVDYGKGIAADHLVAGVSRAVQNI
ncbi:Nif3-like dinuclear metal center hexameric protein [Paenibacillus daejeonensis]|uniref:Nif3-like dinuclear metal center hexameric protein n=1 Tax=Paenibacillus daejeonensis TaxID=135193 RepID=UPI00036702F6|nr:Nif3-like dinuclear metal center hexameric protein [Paenibacillus daejeonensis]